MMNFNFIKGVFWVFCFKILGASSLLLINVLVSNYWGISSVGQFGVVTSSLMMASLFSKVGLDTYVIKFASRSNKKETAYLFYKVLLIISISSSIVGLCFYFLKGNVLILFLVIIYSFFSVLPEFLRALGNSFEYSAVRSFSLNLFVFLILVICIFLGVKPNFYLVYLIATVFSLAVFLLKYIELGGWVNYHKVKFSDLKIIFSETIFMQVSSLSIYFLGSFSVLILSMFFSHEAVGKYFVILQMTMLFNLVITSVGIYVGPRLSRCAAEKNWVGFKKSYLSSSFLCSILLLPLVLVYYNWGGQLLLYFFEIADDDTHFYLMVMSLGFYFNSILGPKFSALNMTGNHKVLTVIMLCFLVFGLVLNFTFASFEVFKLFIFSSVTVNVLLSLACCSYVIFYLKKVS